MAGPDASGFIFVFIMWALLWTLVPLVIAVMWAVERRESVGMAIILTIFLGWIGLAIVYFGQRRVVGAVDRVLTPSRAPAANLRASASGTNGIAQRLRVLDGLHASGTITDEEYATRRRDILSEV